MVYYYIYKTTCLKGKFKGKYYFGQHKTRKLDDKYAGSGRLLVDYFKKYGKVEGETYNIEILAFYDNQEDLNKAEYEIIGDKYETDKNCLNLCSGGWKEGVSDETRELQRQSHIGKKQSEETIEKRMKKIRGKKLPFNKKNSENFKGRSLTDEWKDKIRQKHLGTHKSEEDKEYLRELYKGKHWRINPETNKREWYT